MNRTTITVKAALFLLVLSISAFSQKGEEIIRQERFFYDSLKMKKVDLLPDLFLKNFHGVNSGGYIDRKTEVEGFSHAVLEEYRFSDIIVQFPAKNVGIISYKAYIKGSYKGKDITGDSFHTSTWVKKHNKWKMILHTEVPSTVNSSEKAGGLRMKNFIGISTAAYKVADLTKAKEWYTKAFGVAPYFDEPFYVGFNINGYELGLQPEEEKKSVKCTGSIAYWAVKDIAAVFKKFVELGAAVIEKPNDVGGGVIAASVKDPWGNAIGIIYNPAFKK
jgi:lactoylglutathione lyase